MRRLEMAVRPKMVSVSKKVNQREHGRERKALIAAKHVEPNAFVVWCVFRCSVVA